MKKILIVDKDQFGYHISPYKYATYLSGEFDVTYICWDEGKDKVIHKAVEVIYLQKKGRKVLRFITLLSKISGRIKAGDFNYVFMVYFFGCSLIRTLNPFQKINLDIKTVSVLSETNKNKLYDILLRIESKFFKNISVLNENTGKKLGIANFHVLPLGSECFAEKSIENGFFDFLYVGTLSNRNIMEMVIGFKLFLSSISKSTHYDLVRLVLVGVGYGNEKEEIQEFAKAEGLSEQIIAHGYVPYDQLHKYFQQSKAGVSYVPITPYYTDQPPTKTIEYLISGLPVLATNTNANRELVNEKNGILIQDSAEEAGIGFLNLYESYSKYDSEKIKTESQIYSWDQIVNHNLKEYLNSI